jgi:hypothetical protein
MMVIVEQLVEWRLAGETEVLGENLPSATLSTMNPTWSDLGSNLGCHSGKPVTNHLSYGMAKFCSDLTDPVPEVVFFCVLKIMEVYNVKNTVIQEFYGYYLNVRHYVLC